MDKRFPSTGTKDPFAYKPEYNKGVGPAAAVPPTPDNNDPFAFKPEYNQEVKKKVGGSGLETPSTQSSPTQSTSQLPVETPSDFLSKDVDQSDFYGQLEADSQKYVNAVRGVQGAAPAKVISDVEKEELSRQTKNEILSNPTALGNYNKKRIDQLNKKVDQLYQEQNKYVGKRQVGTMSLTVLENEATYKDIGKQIQETKQYINQLKGNVADVASDFIVAQYNPTNYNPKEVGRQIINIADPELNDQFKLVEKGGLTLPGIRNEEIERLGLAATESYLLKQPETDDRDKFLTLVKDYQNDFDDRNPQMAAQRVREKIAARIYKGDLGYTDKEGIFRSVESSPWGFGYSPEALKLAAEDTETGLTPSEKKVFYANVLPVESKIIGTNIPTSGFTRSFYNAFEKSAIGTGKSIGDITGIRTEGEQALDALNQEMDMSRYRAPGESPTAQAQLTFLKQKETKEKLTEPELKAKKSLENYVGVRNNWSKFKDGVGDLTGQVAFIALVTRGIGSAGSLLTASGTEAGLLGGLTRSAIGQTLSNETTGLILTGYLNSYDNYKQQAIQLMPGEDQAAARDAYAKTMATVEGASELIFRDTKILKAFTRNVAPAAREITQRLINGEITQRIAREELQAGILKVLKPFVKAEVSEGFEEGIVDVAQGIAESAFAGTNFDAAKVGNQALNTFLTTMLYSPLVSGMSAHGAYRQNKSQNAFMKSALLDMGVNPTAYLKSVEDLQLEGAITQQEANEKIQLIKSANKYLGELPSSRPVSVKVGEIETTTQTQMDYPQVTSYLLHRMNEGIIEEKLANTTDPIVESQLKKDLKRSQDIRKGIYDGMIGVTPDIQDVTDNPEQAQELGIADSNQMLPAELIGTPFTSPIEPQKASEEVEAITPSITDEQKKDATGFANELKSEGIIPDTYHNMITEEDATPFWEMVAQQAQNMDANWQPLKGEDNMSEQAAIDAFGETVVDYAKELYPIVQGEAVAERAEEPEQAEAKVADYDALNTTEAKEQFIQDNSLINRSAFETPEEYIDYFEEKRNRVKAAIGDQEKTLIAAGLTPKAVERYKKEDGIEAEYQKVLQEYGLMEPDISQPKTETDEGQKQEAIPATEEGSEEISIPETTPAGNESEGEILTEQGAEPVAEAPLEEQRQPEQEGKKPKENPKISESRKELAQELKSILDKLKGTYNALIKYDPNFTKPANERIVREGGNVLHTLKRIGEQYPEYKQLINELISKADRQSLAVTTRLVNPKGEPQRAFYNAPADVIVFDGNFEAMPLTIIHETIHAMTSLKIPEGFGNSGDKYLKSLVEYRNKHKDEFSAELIELYVDTVYRLGLGNKFFGKDGIANDNAALSVFDTGYESNYGLYNIHEFLAEAFSNPEFQEKIKNIDTGSGTIWNRFIDLIKKLFGISNKSRLQEVIDVGQKIIASKRGEVTSMMGEYYANLADTNKIIRQFIADALSRGESIENIKGALLDNGLSEEEINALMADKPRIRVKVGEERQKEQTEPEEAAAGNIADYKMTTNDKVGKFMSGDTWEDVFGEAPEGDQSYLVQGLSDMLQDGKNMIAIAQKKWGGDVMMYGKNLFQLIQSMSNDAQLSNKKAVLLATFLGELQEAKLRSPERFDAINQLEKAVFSYYQNYMNIRGKEVVAGRLLRFYRDKYIADVFADRILEKEQMKAKKAIQQKEQQKNIDNETASEEVKPITEDEKKKEDKAAKEKSKKAKENQHKKKKIKPDVAKAAAEQKLKDIEGRLGSDAQKGLIGRIKDAINKLNCK